MSAAPQLTDRNALLRNRARAARNPAFFLHEEASDEMQERLSEVNKSFQNLALVGHISPVLTNRFPNTTAVEDAPTLHLKPASHDLVLHFFGLHWADDPIGQLVQSRLALQPDGLFLGVMFGGSTLQELRACLAEVEAHLLGGLSPRVLPMADLRDLGGLLQRAGFALPVADSYRVTVRYRNVASLVRDLRGMGENNALAGRHKQALTRQFWQEIERIYRQNFSDKDGFLLASFELVYLTGWAPSESQQKPLRPGSAQTRLADALKVPEMPLKREE